MWKQIAGFEQYEISDKGEVRRGEHILKPFISNSGYYMLHLWKNRKQYTVSIHRLVALTYIANKHNFPFVNHKDENRLNNISSNLEWCTAKYNINYGKAKEKISNRMKGNRNNVIQETSRTYIKCIETGEIHFRNEWHRLGFMNVEKVCKGKQLTCKHLHFMYC